MYFMSKSKGSAGSMRTAALSPKTQSGRETCLTPQLCLGEGGAAILTLHRRSLFNFLPVTSARKTEGTREHTCYRSLRKSGKDTPKEKALR